MNSHPSVLKFDLYGVQVTNQPLFTLNVWVGVVIIFLRQVCLRVLARVFWNFILRNFVLLLKEFLGRYWCTPPRLACCRWCRLESHRAITRLVSLLVVHDVSQWLALGLWRLMFIFLIWCRESFTRLSFFERTLRFLFNSTIALLDHICLLELIELRVVWLVFFLLVHKSQAWLWSRNFKFTFHLVRLIFLAWSWFTLFEESEIILIFILLVILDILLGCGRQYLLLLLTWER